VAVLHSRVPFKPVDGKETAVAAIEYDFDVKAKDKVAIDTTGAFDTREHDPLQSSLFPLEEMILPEVLQRYRKGVSAIHSVPSVAHTLHTNRLFDAFILIAQLHIRQSRDRTLLERIRKERISPLFETRMSDLVRLANIPGNNFKRVRDDIDRLYDMTLQWNIVGEDGGIEWDMKSHFLALRSFGHGKERGLVRFAIDPSVLEIVLEPKVWATLSLEAMNGMATAASYSLYQNVWRYVGTAQKVTAPLPVTTWIKLLIGPSRYVKVDPATGRESTSSYADFKRRILVDAINRVNQVQALDYTLELKELRVGNRVAKLQFRFVPKKQASLGLPMGWPSDVLQVLAQMGISEKDVADLSQAHSLEEIVEALTRLRAAEVKLRSMGRTITSRRAYFQGILSNVAAGSDEADFDAAKLEAQVQEQAAVMADQQRQERQQGAFAEHRMQVFTANLFQQEPVWLQQLVEEFKASDVGPRNAAFFERPFTPGNRAAVAVFKSWLADTHPDVFERLHPEPKDKTIEAWLAWRIDELERTKPTQR
jgi:hypothetical protein